MGIGYGTRFLSVHHALMLRDEEWVPTVGNPWRRYVEAQRRVPPLGKKETFFFLRKKYDKYFFLQTGSLNRSKLVLAMLSELTRHM